MTSELITIHRGRIERKTRARVDNSLKFLAPYFGLTTDTAINLAKTKFCVELLERCEPSLHLCTKLQLPYEPESDRDDFVIAHELGHWFHKHINPEQDLLISYGRDIYMAYIEGIADYAGVIYDSRNRGGFLTTPDFDINRLSRLSSYQVLDEKAELGVFFKERIVPNIPLVHKYIADILLEFVKRGLLR